MFFLCPSVSLCCMHICINVHVCVECLHVCVCARICVEAVLHGAGLGVMYPAVKLVDNWHHGQTLSSLS